MPKDELFQSINQLKLIILVTFVVALIASVAAVLLYSRWQISQPIHKLVGYANRLAIGDADFTVSTKSKDEIGILTKAFGRMTDGIREQASVSESIARGNMDIALTARSDKDILSLSMISVIGSLKGLSVEFEKLMDAVSHGDFSQRGDETKFEGQYLEMIQGVNEILGETDKAFADVKQASARNEKGSRYMQAEIDKLTVNIQRLARGELLCDMEVAPGDEDTAELAVLFGGIADNLKASVDAFQTYIGNITETLGAISHGNLDIEITGDYQGDFASIKDALITIVDSLNDMMEQMNNAANQVAAGTGQVSDGAQALSQGATEQASAIEELTTSLNEIAAQTRQNAANAHEASELATIARNNAAQGNEQMKQMQQAMTGINESSSSISKIIKVIDDIAFQTNLLALNAAVEAARAGQHGKGFAVVAEEVRSLAARSAAAAKETTTMIEESIKKVQTGTVIADATAEALSNIVDDVDKATVLVEGIAQASAQQAGAVAQVHTGVEQVSQVVQTTSATAEESAATSEELAGQAETLKQMIAHFHLKGAQAAQPRTQANTVRQLASGKTNKPKIALGDTEFAKY